MGYPICPLSKGSGNNHFSQAQFELCYRHNLAPSYVSARNCDNILQKDAWSCHFTEEEKKEEEKKEDESKEKEEEKPKAENKTEEKTEGEKTEEKKTNGEWCFEWLGAFHSFFLFSCFCCFR